jgi:hypothetical protein
VINERLPHLEYGEIAKAGNIDPLALPDDAAHRCRLKKAFLYSFDGHACVLLRNYCPIFLWSRAAWYCLAFCKCSA